jgi:hypothetical protein
MYYNEVDPSNELIRRMRAHIVMCAAEAVKIKAYSGDEDEIDRRCNDLALRLRDLAVMDLGE